LALGASPWAKIQAAPVAVALGLLLLATIFRSENLSSSWLRRGKEVVALACGAVLTTCIFLVVVAESGALRDFWTSYILSKAAFAGKLSLAHGLEDFSLMCLLSPVNQLLLVAILGIYLLDYASASGEAMLAFKKQGWALGGLLIYAGAGLFATCRPEYPSPKHAIFFIPPMAYIAAILASWGVTALMRSFPQRQTPTAGILMPLLGVLLLGATVALYLGYLIRYGTMIRAIHELSSHEQAEPAAEITNRVPQLQVAETNDTANMSFHLANALGPANWEVPDFGNQRIVAVVANIKRTQPVRSLAIWGWAPGVYVLTGIPPATQDTIGYWAISEGLYQKYFQTRFLGDLRANPPDLFIDAVAKGVIMWHWGWTENDGYESYPELRKFIDDNYVLVAGLTLQPGAKPVRFFARREPASH
jgi:hypothetical protein